MRVLITIERRPTHRYLIHLFTKDLISKVQNLIDKKQHHKACVMALRNGVVLREVRDHELTEVHADLILSENSARWDLVKSE